MDKALRNTLRNTVTQCRKLLEEAVRGLLEGQYGIHASGQVEDAAHMGHLDHQDQLYREDLLAHLAHIRAGGMKPADAVAQLVREIAFTHLNRLVAFKMMEARGLIREAVSRGTKSQGFIFYLADHPEDEQLWSGGQPERAYRHFLRWLGATFGAEIPALFDPLDPANRAYPPHKVLDQALELLNGADLAGIWTEDEAIGWVYQYFTPKELREQARKESAAPRNSYELAFRNQFYTPRYVVEFLTDNTLGRIWYELRQGQTALTERCRYLVRRQRPVFLKPDDAPPAPFQGSEDWGDPDLPGEMWTRPNPELQHLGAIWRYALTVGGYDYARAHLGRDCADLANERAQHYRETRRWEGAFEELRCCLFFEQRRYHHFGEDPEGEELAAIQALYQAICARWDLETEHIAYRPPKDPRQITMLDPAGGSGHFALYCFDLYEVIYREAYDDPGLGADLRREYPDRDAFLRAVPALILEHNLHLIDIDPRACQIAALALWLRAQRAYQELGLKPEERPQITRAHVVCAEPMPGDRELLEEYLKTVDARLRPLVRTIWVKMQLAGEAGSLLKIEEEIEGELNKARREALADYGAVQATLFQADQPPQQMRLDLRPSEDDRAFWERAEGELLAALRDYARRAANGQGLRRQLFAEDAERGLAFIDLCRQRYDVVLMNPPYGDVSPSVKQYTQSSFKGQPNDLFGCFIERSLNIGDFVGSLTSRTFLFFSSFESLRTNCIFPLKHIAAVTDLGFGVLDDALVETCAMALENHRGNASGTVFFRLTDCEEKAAMLVDAVDGVRMSRASVESFSVCESVFRAIEGAPMPYWAGQTILGRILAYPPVYPEYADIRLGAVTSDNDRFVRLRWEVGAGQINPKSGWATYAKGGDYSKYFGDIHLLVDWRGNGEHIESSSGQAVRLRDLAQYMKPGLTYPLVTVKGMNVRVLPADCVFDNGSPSIFLPDSDSRLVALGVLNSRLVELYVRCFTSSRHWQVGYVRKVPWPAEGIAREREKLRKLSFEAVEVPRGMLRGIEPTAEFLLPRLLQSACNHGPLDELLNVAQDTFRVARSRFAELETALDNTVKACYGFSTEEWSVVEREVPTIEVSRDQFSGIDSSKGELVAEALIWTAGCAFGRWDIRLATGEREMPELGDAFAPLPACPPGMLQSAEGLPARPEDLSPSYPIRVAWEGILVDDPDHPEDIVRRAREVLALLWGERAEAIEQEACGILGVAELREYFRRPAKGGFWLDHVQRYSKSRRQAPIYWLLQSAKKSYGLWLYYHRLDKDLLYKALVNYVEPKVRLEAARLAELRAERRAVGVAGRAAKELEKRSERQEALVAEIEDFRDKLRRAADLHLEPDLNDGVALNIAPLWELAPWKVAKEYWEALLAGQYEWSSIGKQLRERGRVR